MPRSISRGRERERTRSVTPRSPDSRSPSRSPRRYISPRRSRSPSYHRNDGRRSISRSPSPASVSTKVGTRTPLNCTIVVEKLTKNINETHLRELFEVFGEIVDMDMPMNRQYGTNRGTAYILYALESDANQAIAHMHEAQVDGAIISVSVVIPRRKFSPSPPLARRGGGGGGGRGDFRGRLGGPPRRRSPRGFNRGGPSDTYRPRSLSRSPRPRRSRSRSFSPRSRSPPPRRRERHDSAERAGGRKRSPSYGSYSSGRSRSRSGGYPSKRGRW